MDREDEVQPPFPLLGREALRDGLKVRADFLEVLIHRLAHAGLGPQAFALLLIRTPVRNPIGPNLLCISVRQPRIFFLVARPK
jgi:hypothetical protein